MPDKFGIKPEYLSIIIQAFRDEETIQQAILFGSRAIGNFKNGSDIDIALKGERLTQEKITRLSYKLNEETPLPYKFDLLNYHTANNAYLLKEIDDKGIEIYSKIIN